MSLNITTSNFLNTRWIANPEQKIVFDSQRHTFTTVNGADDYTSRQFRTLTSRVRECVNQTTFASLSPTQKLNAYSNISAYNAMCSRYNNNIDESCLWRIVNLIVSIITCRRIQLTYEPITRPNWDYTSLMKDDKGEYVPDNYGELVPYFENDLDAIRDFIPLIRCVLAFSTHLILDSEPARKTQLLLIANEEARIVPYSYKFISAIQACWGNTPDIIMDLYLHLLSLPQIDQLTHAQRCLHQSFLSIEPQTLPSESLKRYLTLMAALNRPPAKPEWHQQVIDNTSLMIGFLDAILSLPADMLKAHSEYTGQVTLHTFSKAEKEQDILDLLKYCAQFHPQAIKEFSTQIQALIGKALLLAKEMKTEGRKTVRKMKTEDQKRLLDYLSILRNKGIAADAYLDANRQLFLELFLELRKAKATYSTEFELYFLERCCGQVKDLSAEELAPFNELLLQREAEAKELFVFRRENPIANRRTILFNLMEYLGTQAKLSDEVIYARSAPYFEKVRAIQDVASGPSKKDNMTYKEREKLLVCANRIARFHCPNPKTYGRLKALLRPDRIVSLVTHLSNDPGFIKKCNAIATHLLFAVLIEDVKVGKDIDVRWILQDLNISQLTAQEFDWLTAKKIFTQDRDRFVGNASVAQLETLYGKEEGELEINFQHIRQSIGTEAPIPDLPAADRDMRLSELITLFEKVKSAAIKEDDTAEIMISLESLVKNITNKSLGAHPVDSLQRTKGYKDIELYLKHGMIACRTKHPSSVYIQLKDLSKVGIGFCFRGVKSAAQDFYYQTTGREQRVEASTPKAGLVSLYRMMRKQIFLRNMHLLWEDYASKSRINKRLDVHERHEAIKTVGKAFNIEGWEEDSEDDAAREVSVFFIKPEVQQTLLTLCLRDYTGHAIVNFFFQGVYGLPDSPQVISGELQFLFHDWFQENRPSKEKDPLKFKNKVLQLDESGSGVGRMKREYAIYFLRSNGIFYPQKAWYQSSTKLTTDEQRLAAFLTRR